MPYSIHVARVQQAVWDSLPDLAREQLASALWRVRDDPYGETDPYGEDDGITRMCVLPNLVLVLLIMEPMKRITLLQITYLG